MDKLILALYAWLILMFFVGCGSIPSTHDQFIIESQDMTTQDYVDYEREREFKLGGYNE